MLCILKLFIILLDPKAKPVHANSCFYCSRNKQLFAGGVTFSPSTCFEVRDMIIIDVYQTLVYFYTHRYSITFLNSSTMLAFMNFVQSCFRVYFRSKTHRLLHSYGFSESVGKSTFELQDTAWALKLTKCTAKPTINK